MYPACKRVSLDSPVMNIVKMSKRAYTAGQDQRSYVKIDCALKDVLLLHEVSGFIQTSLAEILYSLW